MRYANSRDPRFTSWKPTQQSTSSPLTLENSLLLITAIATSSHVLQNHTIHNNSTHSSFLPLLPRLPRQWPISHPHRSYPTHALVATIHTSQPRGIFRIPKPTTRLARLHGIPPLPPAPRRDQPLAALAIPLLETCCISAAGISSR